MPERRTGPPSHVHPSLAEWRRLYEAAARIAEMAPWQWMYESEIFGVLDTESDRLGFVSIMGQLGEHFSVAVYQGAAGLAAFLELEDLDPPAGAESVLLLPHLQASFEGRSLLQAEDHRVIKSLGLKFRGRNAWPMFRSYRPGWLPWILDAAEARFLATALDQVLDVAPRAERGELDLEPLDDRYLVRIPPTADGDPEWTESWQTVEFPDPEPIPVYADPRALEHLKSCQVTPHMLQVAFDRVPFMIAEKDQRPYSPHMLLVVDAASGFILAGEIVPPEPTPAQTLGQAPLHLSRVLARAEIRPKRIEVRSEQLARLFRHVFGPLAVPVKVVADLPALDEATEAMSRLR